MSHGMQTGDRMSSRRTGTTSSSDNQPLQFSHPAEGFDGSEFRSGDDGGIAGRAGDDAGHGGRRSGRCRRIGRRFWKRAWGGRRRGFGCRLWFRHRDRFERRCRGRGCDQFACHGFSRDDRVRCRSGLRQWLRDRRWLRRLDRRRLDHHRRHAGRVHQIRRRCRWRRWRAWQRTRGGRPFARAAFPAFAAVGRDANDAIVAYFRQRQRQRQQHQAIHERRARCPAPPRPG